MQESPQRTDSLRDVFFVGAGAFVFFSIGFASPILFARVAALYGMSHMRLVAPLLPYDSVSHSVYAGATLLVCALAILAGLVAARFAIDSRKRERLIINVEAITQVIFGVALYKAIAGDADARFALVASAGWWTFMGVLLAAAKRSDTGGAMPWDWFVNVTNIGAWGGFSISTIACAFPLVALVMLSESRNELLVALLGGSLTSTAWVLFAWNRHIRKCNNSDLRMAQREV